MFHIENQTIRELLFEGNFGLEKESLRITPDGNMAHTPHPFPGHKHIVRDFCENQTEINTSVTHSPEEAVSQLFQYTCEIMKELSALDQPELLWPFSNPPYIINEDDIPVAIFDGEQASKTVYREYLSDRYGRYKMTFSGIHVNFSFSEKLLYEEFKLSGEKDFVEFQNRVYLELAEKSAAYSWILTVLTAASPLMDSSYVEKGVYGQNEFNGMATTRCSELGYWNYFAPLFDYTDIRAYADSIQKYVDLGLIAAPSELYYPVRLKPRGENNLERLRSEGVDHIEFRMFDLNPLCLQGIDVRDLKFTQLLLIYLMGTPMEHLLPKDQVQAVQNFKNAAHYDLKTVKIVLPKGKAQPVVDTGIELIGLMKDFYKDFPQDVKNILDFEEEKLTNPEKRYAWILKKQQANGFVENGLALAKNIQEIILNV